MKRKLSAIFMASIAALTVTGCSLIPKPEFKMTKNVGEKYYISVQSVTKHEKPDATSKALGTMNMGDSVVIGKLVPHEGHLATDQADSWIEVADGGSVYYIPGNTIVSTVLWEEQLGGRPPRGGVKVKNFTSSKHQDADAELDQANFSRKEIYFLLGANGSMSSEDGKAYPVELGEYIKKQSPNAGNLKIKLPETKRSLLDFPSPQSFLEIGPYQEFDMGAGLAAFMMKNALAPTHPVTVYVKSIVDRLVKHSSLPYAYGGFHVIVLKDDETVNACAAPGGFVFVTTGMLKYLNSEEELALILAHEIGHLEFHHSVRELGVADYGSFAVAALTAGIDLTDPRIKEAIVQLAKDTVAKIPFSEKLSQEVRDQKIAETVEFTTEKLQVAIDSAKEQIMKLLQIIGGSLEKGHAVEFEAAADRRAVSLAAAAGYKADALLAVLARIKADNNGFGEAYPVNRDELVEQFKVFYPVEASAQTVGDYKAIRTQVEKLTGADLFITK